MNSQVDNRTNSDPYSNDPRFVAYYAHASDTDAARERSLSIMRAVLRARHLAGFPVQSLLVADVGCNAGTQSRCWLECGHTVRGLDVSRELIQIARSRSAEFGDRAAYEIGTAEAVPWPANSFDVYLMPELLEHVHDWKACLSEAARVIKPGGSLYVSTTNVLCPVQQEFELPFYSWYPAFLKGYCLKRAMTTSRKWVNYATHPAYHWFSPYSLRSFLVPFGFRVLDRFDLIDTSVKGRAAELIVKAARSNAMARLLGHMLTPGTTIVAHKAL